MNFTLSMKQGSPDVLVFLADMVLVPRIMTEMCSLEGLMGRAKHGILSRHFAAGSICS